MNGDGVVFAVYGALDGGVATNDKAYDVTAKLYEVLEKFQGVVKCDNETMGGDPAPGNTKHFAALVIRKGKAYAYACEEGQTIDFRVGGGNTPEANILVEYAAYGALPGGDPKGAKGYDVTGVVREMLRVSNTVRVDNEIFGDPAPGNTKHFAAIVNRNGTRFSYACQEGQTLDFSKGGGDIKIIP